MIKYSLDRCAISRTYLSARSCGPATASCSLEIHVAWCSGGVDTTSGCQQFPLLHNFCSLLPPSSCRTRRCAVKQRESARMSSPPGDPQSSYWLILVWCREMLIINTNTLAKPQFPSLPWVVSLFRLRERYHSRLNGREARPTDSLAVMSSTLIELANMHVLLYPE